MLYVSLVRHFMFPAVQVVEDEEDEVDVDPTGFGTTATGGTETTGTLAVVTGLTEPVVKGTTGGSEGI